jgi:hypothetical protein
MDWEDYLDFDISQIEDMAGYDAVKAIKDLVESTIQPLIDALEFAESPAEIEMAEAELKATRISFDEAQTIAEDYELYHLTDLMSSSYKDQDVIDRYLELTGQGYYGGGGGGSSAAPISEAEKKRREEKRRREQAKRRAAAARKRG